MPDVNLFIIQEERYDDINTIQQKDDISYTKYNRKRAIEEYVVLTSQGCSKEFTPYSQYFNFVTRQFLESHQFNFLAVSLEDGDLEPTSLYVNCVEDPLIRILNMYFRVSEDILIIIDEWVQKDVSNGILYRFDTEGNLNHIHLNFKTASYEALIEELGAFMTLSQLIAFKQRSPTIEEISGVVRYSVASNSFNRVDIQL